MPSFRLLYAGFSGQEVGQVVSATNRTKSNEVSKFSFAIKFKGNSSTLHIEVKMEDADAVNIYFFADPTLAEHIAREIKKFSEEHGL
jgi:hypothetical protein